MKRTTRTIQRNQALGGVPIPPYAGYAYAIFNPVWPHAVKLGCAGDITMRLNGALTWDPQRAFRLIAHSDLAYHPKRVEALAHRHFATARICADPASEAYGEWFRITPEQARAWMVEVSATLPRVHALAPEKVAPEGRSAADWLEWMDKQHK